MSLRFLASGGNMIFSKGGGVAGIWGTAGINPVSNAPSGRTTTYAYQNAANAASNTTPNLGGNYTTLVAGYAVYPPALSANALILATFDSGVNAVQTDLRMDISGLLFFTRNGTNLGAGNPTKSTFALSANVWCYIEIKVVHATGATGSAEVKVNGVSVLSLTSVQTANTNATANQFRFFNTPSSSFTTDFYVVDGDAGGRTSYLGDINVIEMFANGAGTHSQWLLGTNNGGTASPPPFTLSSVNTVGVYVRTVTATGETANAYVGYYFSVTGFTNGANNQSNVICTASTTTTITLGGVTISETHTGTMTFQSIVQAGIHGSFGDGAATTNVGTRPNDDAAYIIDSTTNDQTDFAHQALTLTGTVQGVVHYTYAKKDDAGTRQIAQQCLSGATTETSSTISLGSSYQYYADVLENDPNTSSAWTTSNLNSATFGVKQLT